jgi:hypothetical protein
MTMDRITIETGDQQIAMQMIGATVYSLLGADWNVQRWEYRLDDSDFTNFCYRWSIELVRLVPVSGSGVAEGM